MLHFRTVIRPVFNIDRRSSLASRLGGFAPFHYELQYHFQGGRCSVCHKQLGGLLHCDHDHITGQLRGCLCRRCNSRLRLSGGRERWIGPDSLRDDAEQYMADWHEVAELNI